MRDARTALDAVSAAICFLEQRKNHDRKLRIYLKQCYFDTVFELILGFDNHFKSKVDMELYHLEAYAHF